MVYSHQSLLGPEYEVGVLLELLLELLHPLVQEVLRHDHVVPTVALVHVGQIAAVTSHEVVQVLSHALSIHLASVLLGQLVDLYQVLERVRLYANLYGRVGIAQSQVGDIEVHPPPSGEGVTRPHVSDGPDIVQGCVGGHRVVQGQSCILGKGSHQYEGDVLRILGVGDVAVEHAIGALEAGNRGQAWDDDRERSSHSIVWMDQTYKLIQQFCLHQSSRTIIYFTLPHLDAFNKYSQPMGYQTPSMTTNNVNIHQYLLTELGPLEILPINDYNKILMYGGGGFGFGFQSPQDTNPFQPGVQHSPYDHDPSRPGIQAAGSINRVPHMDSPFDSNPYIAGTQTNNGLNSTGNCNNGYRIENGLKVFGGIPKRY